MGWDIYKLPHNSGDMYKWGEFLSLINSSKFGTVPVVIGSLILIIPSNEINISDDFKHSCLILFFYKWLKARIEEAKIVHISS